MNCNAYDSVSIIDFHNNYAKYDMNINKISQNIKRDKIHIFSLSINHIPIIQIQVYRSK